MTDDIVVASQNDFEAVLASIARAHRMVFISGLPGVGKSLFIRELARVAHAIGRDTHLLQWDVVRLAFESRAILARYPDRDGATHAVIRKAVGQWVRKAVVRWHREHGRSSSMLIAEVPLIGNRLVELAQVHADDAEPLLAGPETLFVTPVPSAPVRAAIERARERTSANPANPRESADAAINVLQELWLDTRVRAVEIGAAAPAAEARPPFDPQAYAAVYRHLLRRRKALTVRMDVELESNASVYDLAVEATDIVPSADEAAEILMRLEREHTTAEIESDVARWFQSI
ncbi:MAG: hypothetical protein ABWZ29_08585 [Casimicrobiaceae bacterium]